MIKILSATLLNLHIFISHMYLDANNWYGWAMSQKTPVNGFEWEQNIHKFNDDFIKNYDEDSNQGYFLEVDVEYPENVFNLHSNSPFLPDTNKIGKCNKLVCNIHDKKTMLFT